MFYEGETYINIIVHTPIYDNKFSVYFLHEFCFPELHRFFFCKTDYAIIVITRKEETPPQLYK